MCRKTLADSRPRVRGRFARNDDAGAVMPHETKKAQAAARRSAAAQGAKGAGAPCSPARLACWQCCQLRRLLLRAAFGGALPCHQADTQCACPPGQVLRPAGLSLVTGGRARRAGRGAGKRCGRRQGGSGMRAGLPAAGAAGRCAGGAVCARRARRGRRGAGQRVCAGGQPGCGHDAHDGLHGNGERQRAAVPVCAGPFCGACAAGAGPARMSAPDQAAPPGA